MVPSSIPTFLQSASAYCQAVVSLQGLFAPLRTTGLHPPFHAGHSGPHAFRVHSALAFRPYLIVPLHAQWLVATQSAPGQTADAQESATAAADPQV